MSSTLKHFPPFAFRAPAARSPLLADHTNATVSTTERYYCRDRAPGDSRGMFFPYDYVLRMIGMEMEKSVE